MENANDLPRHLAKTTHWKAPAMLQSFSLQRWRKLKGHQAGPDSNMNLIRRLHLHALLAKKAVIVPFPPKENTPSPRGGDEKYLPRALTTPFPSLTKNPLIPRMPRPSKLAWHGILGTVELNSEDGLMSGIIEFSRETKILCSRYCLIMV